MRIIDADEIPYLYPMDEEGNEGDGMTLQSTIDEVPTIEAIPKADYENRLKADMVAMLEKILSECDKLKHEPCCCLHYKRGIRFSEAIIQEHINALKENEDGTN